MIRYDITYYDRSATWAKTCGESSEVGLMAMGIVDSVFGKKSSEDLFVSARSQLAAGRRARRSASRRALAVVRRCKLESLASVTTAPYVVRSVSGRYATGPSLRRHQSTRKSVSSGLGS